MTLIGTDFRKKNVLRKSLGYNEELWLMMKESGYDVTFKKIEKNFLKT